jgi:Beta-propeller repeat
VKFLNRFAAVVLFAGWVAFADGETVEWIRQVGTNRIDYVSGVSADSIGNIYVSGWTDNVAGQENGGRYKLTLTKYSIAGDLLWSRRFDDAALATSNLSSSGVAADRFGNVVIAGNITNHFFQSDAYLVGYDGAGNLSWTRSFGTASDDSIRGIATDGEGSFYVAGSTGGNLGGANLDGWDAFIAKYDAAGNEIWTRQFGTPKPDDAFAVTTDRLGNVYIAGATNGDLGGPNGGGVNAYGTDMFVAKYDAAGNQLWTRQWGTAETEQGYNIAADQLGNVFVSGEINGQASSTFLNCYDSSGNLLSTNQTGNSYTGTSRAIAADGLGNVYVTAETFTEFGQPAAPSENTFISKYSAGGNLFWTNDFGNGDETVFGMTTDGAASIFVAGITFGNLAALQAGNGDMFVAKIADPVVPEPSALALILLSILTIPSRMCRLGESMPSGTKCAQTG